jgi:hypothetical protein
MRKTASEPHSIRARWKLYSVQTFTTRRFARAIRHSGADAMPHAIPASVLLRDWVKLGIVERTGGRRWRITEYGVELAEAAALIEALR